MFNVGGGEVLVILIAALIVLGPDKLPNAARQVGKYLAEFRRISQGFQDELRGAIDVANLPQSETMPQPGPEVAEVAEVAGAEAEPAVRPAPESPTSSDPPDPREGSGPVTGLGPGDPTAA